PSRRPFPRRTRAAAERPRFYGRRPAASRTSVAWWAAGAATIPTERVARPMSNHVAPAMSATVAPARSALSPAAATPHADIPADWRNASNRPFATYASASAAEPMFRDTRIALRIAPTRLVTARPPSASDTT